MKEKDINGKILYQNHYLMKQNRLIKLQQTKSKCEVCNRRANLIHHKDGTYDNHNLENLIVLCHSCHAIIHAKRGNLNKHTSKYIREYGLTLQEISKKLHASQTTIWQWHKKKILQDRLNSLDKIGKLW